MRAQTDREALTQTELQRRTSLLAPSKVTRIHTRVCVQIAVFADFPETTEVFVTLWSCKPFLTTTAYHTLSENILEKLLMSNLPADRALQVMSIHLTIIYSRINLCLFLFSVSPVHQSLPGNASGVFVGNLVSHSHTWLSHLTSLLTLSNTSKQLSL